MLIFFLKKEYFSTLQAPTGTSLFNFFVLSTGGWVVEETLIFIELLVSPMPVKLAPFDVNKLYMLRLFSVIRAEHQIRM